MAKAEAETDIEVELNFLQELEKGESISQKSLAQNLRISVGMANALIKRAAKKGYIKVRGAPYKRYAYYLTPVGFSQKSKLVAEYIDTSLTFFRTVRAQYGALIVSARESGRSRVVLYGKSELTEIAMLAALEAGHPVGVAIAYEGVDCSELAQADCVLLTEYQNAQAAYDYLKGLGYGAKVMAPAVLGVKE